jgi:hypothetical protein
MNVVAKTYFLLVVIVILDLLIIIGNILTLKICPTGVFFISIGLVFILTGGYQLHVKNDIFQYLKRSNKDVKLSSLKVYLIFYSFIGYMFLALGIIKIVEFFE